MNNDLLNNQDLDFELKKLIKNIENIDNIKFDVDLYSVIVEENLLAETV